MSRTFTILILLCCMQLMTPFLPAGEVDPTFAHRLQNAAPGESFRAIVMMKDRVDVQALDRRLKAMSATRGFRHEVIVTSLQQKARATQLPLIALLERLKGEGEDVTFEAVWIVNAVLLRSTPEVIAYAARLPEVEVVYDGGVPIEVIQEAFDHGPTPNYNPLDAPEPGLVGIKVPDLWARGYRGKGRLVANLDTGVDGNHPALKSRWRGNDPGVTVKEAWFDPTNRSFPYARTYHGTHVMGTICGLDGSNQIGVAPEAKWIAAMWRYPPVTVFNDDVIKAFQWASDPDGKPETINDVPDAICNSWGLSPFVSSYGVKKCDVLFWNAIDNCEFSGCAVVFCAGNEASRGAESLRVPADRITSPVSVFSVGALSTDQKTIATFSSRGPSGCDSKTFKPEVCAQGYKVRSAYPNNQYRELSGTSMATPHVTGAIALLRQVWPHVTAQRVKEILLETCDDLGPTGDDNTFGMGRINLLRAHDKLVSERPVVSVSVMGVLSTYKGGESFRAHIVLANNTRQEQSARVSLQFFFENQPTSLVIVPPTDLVLPGEFSNQGLPILVEIEIPTDLPGAVLDPKRWFFRGVVEKYGGGSKLHSSEYVFTILK